jgi:hypothetical protein
MAKVEEHTFGGHTTWIFFCPGCGHQHAYFTKAEHPQKPVWQFNGDVDNPTFTPSLLNTWGPQENPHKNVCHLYVKNGMIEYLADCTHHLAGQTVPMVDINE